MKKYKNDLILVFSILIISAIFVFIFIFTSSNNNVRALVYRDDELLEDINLDVDNIYIVEGRISSVKIEVKDKKIRIIESDCDDHICINQGFVDKSGQTITCLPNHVYIRIASNEGVDVIL